MDVQEIKEKIYSINTQLKPEYKKTCSVSKLCAYIKPEFDEIKVATACAAKGQNNPDYKYYNMSVEQILDLWHEKSDTSKKYGSLFDEYTYFISNNLKQTEQFQEWMIKNNFNTDERLKNNCTGFDQFYAKLTSTTNYIYVDSEIPMYTCTPEGNKITGRLDALFYDPNTNGFIIIDYKTTDNISTSSDYNKKLNGPLYMLDDCDMNPYTVQLHVYKKALVETYKLCPYENISVYICNALREPDENNRLYKLIPQNFKFDINLLNKCINFGALKYKINK